MSQQPSTPRRFTARTHTGRRIVAVRETVPCEVGVLSFDAHGEAEYDSNGAKMDWDGQNRAPGPSFVDEDGKHWFWSSLTLEEIDDDAV